MQLGLEVPVRHFLDLYNRNVGTLDLDIGVGTGYFLDRCRLPVERPEITLLDLSDACLPQRGEYALERYSPYVVKVMDAPPYLGTARFASIALNAAPPLPPGHNRAQKRPSSRQPETVTGGRRHRLRKHDPRERR